MRIFAPDGKLTGFLNKLGDLIVLNIFAIVCCIPIVTVGASLTALYTVTLKMAKNEEGKVIPEFIKAFRSNFKQSTLLWGISGGMMGFIFFDIYICRFVPGTFGRIYIGILIAALVIISMIGMYFFPVLARFTNTTKVTAKNAALFCMSHFFKSLIMLVMNLVPLVLLAVSMRFLPAAVLLGLSGPAFITSIYYRYVFKPFEVQAA